MNNFIKQAKLEVRPKGFATYIRVLIQELQTAPVGILSLEINKSKIWKK